MDAGAAAVVRKPFSPLELLAAVERASGTIPAPLISEAGDTDRADQLLLYAEDVRRLLEVERRHRKTLERSYRETLGALANALESRDFGTGAHSIRVQRYAWELTGVVAPELLSDPSVEFGYLLHDIGKIGIPGPRPLQARPVDARRALPDGDAHDARRADRRRRRAPRRERDPDRSPPPRALGRPGLPRLPRGERSRSRLASSPSRMRSTR